MRLALLMIVLVLSVCYGYASRATMTPYEEPTAEQVSKIRSGELRYEERCGRFVIVPATGRPRDLDEEALLAAAAAAEGR